MKAAGAILLGTSALLFITAVTLLFIAGITEWAPEDGGSLTLGFFLSITSTFVVGAILASEGDLR